MFKFAYSQLLKNQNKLSSKLDSIYNKLTEKDSISTFNYKDYVFHLSHSSIEISYNDNYLGSFFKVDEKKYRCIRRDGSRSMEISSDYTSVKEIFYALVEEHVKDIDYMTVFRDSIIEMVQMKTNEKY